MKSESRASTCPAPTIATLRGKRSTQLAQLSMEFSFALPHTPLDAGLAERLLAGCGADIDSAAASTLITTLDALAESPALDIDILIRRFHPEFRPYREGRNFKRGAVLHPGNRQYREAVRRLTPAVAAARELISNTRP